MPSHEHRQETDRTAPTYTVNFSRAALNSSLLKFDSSLSPGALLWYHGRQRVGPSLL